MPNTPELTINVRENNRKIVIKANVKDSLHASRLADRLNALPYLKVYDRSFIDATSTVYAYTIQGLYTLEKLHNDLDTMSDLIILPENEEN